MGGQFQPRHDQVVSQVCRSAGEGARSLRLAVAAFSRSLADYLRKRRIVPDMGDGDLLTQPEFRNAPRLPGSP